MIEDTPRLGAPVYIKHGDLKANSNFTLQIYDAMNVTTRGHAVDVQRHRAVWVVFVNGDTDRISLLNNGISIKKHKNRSIRNKSLYQQHVHS